MLVARFRLAAPLSSLGVIGASMGQPNADVPRDVARWARFSIQTGGLGKAPRRHPRSYDATREVAERLEAFWLAGFEKWGEIRASRYGGSSGRQSLLPTLIRSRRNAKGSGR